MIFIGHDHAVEPSCNKDNESLKAYKYNHDSHGSLSKSLQNLINVSLLIYSFFPRNTFLQLVISEVLMTNNYCIPTFKIHICNSIIM